MNNIYKTLFAVSALFLIIFGSCTEKKDLNDKIQGDWIIKNAARNGRITYTLEGAYLKFYDRNYVETNLLGEPVVTNYIFEENVMIIDSFLSDIIVDRVDTDTLWLHTVIQDNRFSLLLLNTNKNEKKIPN